MKFRISTKRAALIAAIAGTTAFNAIGAKAAVFDWTGGSGNWNTVGTPGWSGGPPNAIGDVAQRVTAQSSSIHIALDTNDVTVGSIKVGNGTPLGNFYVEIDVKNNKILNLNNNGNGATIEWNSPTDGDTNQLWIDGFGQNYAGGGTQSGAINLQDNLEINVLSASNIVTPRGTITFDTVITGTGNITINSAQPLPNFGLSLGSSTEPQQVKAGVSFFRNNDYVGTTTIERGAFQFGASTAFGNSANTINLGVAGSDSAAILSAGTGTLTLANPIVVASGNTGTLTLDNPSSSVSNSVTYSGSITLGSNLNIVSRSTAENQIFTGDISGSGGVIFPSGINQNGQTSFRGNNTYTGDTLIDGQTLVVRNGNAIPNGPGSGVLTVNGTLRLGTNETINGLNGTGSVGIVSAARTLTVGDNDADGSFSGTLVDGLSINKIGNGTQTLSGANTYTGTTTVGAGTLLVNGTHAGGVIYTVASGAALGGTGTIGSSIDIDGKLLVDYDGDADTINMLTITGALDITGATLDFNNLGVGALDGGPHVFASYASLAGTFGSVLDLPAGYGIKYDFGGNQIALVHAGDFNGDGDVNGDDFALWQMNFPTASGASLGQGDGDGDGDVDGADFVIWQTNFPFPSGSATPVPEPSGLSLLAVVGLFGWGWLGSRGKFASRNEISVTV